MKKIFLILTCAFALINSEGNAIAIENKVPNTLSIKGEAVIYKPADQIELVFDVMTEDNDPQKAVEENNFIMNQTLLNLQEVGLTKEEYYTSNYQLLAIFKTKDHYTGEQILDHYRVHHVLTIKTQKMDLSETIIGAAIAGGVNQIQSMNFSSSNTQANREEAIQQAVKNGLSLAKVVADAAGVKIVKVIKIGVDQVNYNNPRMFDQMALAKWNGFNPPIQAGPIEVQADINIVFEIVTK